MLLGYNEIAAAGDTGLVASSWLSNPASPLEAFSQVPVFIQEVLRWCSAGELIDDSVLVRGQTHSAHALAWMEQRKQRSYVAAALRPPWGWDFVWGGERLRPVFCMHDEVLLLPSWSAFYVVKMQIMASRLWTQWTVLSVDEFFLGCQSSGILQNTWTAALTRGTTCLMWWWCRGRNVWVVEIKKLSEILCALDFALHWKSELF